jgi:natural product biosynthesis luciferase-like monooxygenase protein
MTSSRKRLESMTSEQKCQLLQATLAQRNERLKQPEWGHWWVKPLTLRPNAARRVLCFPDGGADATTFFSWTELFPPDIQLLAVDLPGAGSSAWDPIQPSIDDAAKAIAESLLPWLDRPCVFYGHGLGGALAFATALALRARHKREPEALVLSAIAPPGEPPAFETIETVAVQDLCSVGGIETSSVTNGAWTPLFECAPADSALLSDWSARKCEPLDAPIFALAGLEDRKVSSNAMAGWATFTRGAFTLQTVRTQTSDPAAVIERVCRVAGSGPVRSGLGTSVATTPRNTRMRVSLFFFSANDAEVDSDRYRLFDTAVQFADRSGFEAVWIPERHFHPVGGLFPNPSVLGAAVAASTRQLRIRSGSVVLPLHDPIRVAEEWAVVDNLSGGRIDMGVVPGWNPNDYALAPDAYTDRWIHLFEKVDIVRRLWRGETTARRNGRDETIQVRLHPRPLQRELNVWVATSANDDSFIRAGELGLNVLTALLIQPVEGFARRVRLYREARRLAGHDPDAGAVTLMVPTFVGESDDRARRLVREPFLAYMRTVQSLWKETVKELRVDNAVTQELLEDMVFERYFQKSTLFGSIETCLQRAEAFQHAGATELACLVDFGIPHEHNMANLGGIDRLRAALNEDRHR